MLSFAFMVAGYAHARGWVPTAGWLRQLLVIQPVSAGVFGVPAAVVVILAMSWWARLHGARSRQRSARESLRFQRTLLRIRSIMPTPEDIARLTSLVLLATFALSALLGAIVHRTNFCTMGAYPPDAR